MTKNITKNDQKNTKMTKHITKMTKNITKTIIVIDDIDYIQINEKKILNAFIKHFKYEEKKSIKRNYTIIFCGTNYYDKKIKELIKMCNVIKMETLYKPLL